MEEEGEEDDEHALERILSGDIYKEENKTFDYVFYNHNNKRALLTNTFISTRNTRMGLLEIITYATS